MAFSAVKTRFLQQLSSERSVFPYFSFAGFFVELHEKTLQIRYSFSWLLKMDMATLSAKVFKHHKKTDGTFNVKVCIHHNNKRVYMDTEHYVTDKKLDKNLKIRDTTVNRILYVLLDEYREAISLLGVKVDLMTVDDIKAYLLKRNEKVDLLAFGQIHIDYLESQSRKKSASTYRTLRNSLIDFLRSTTLHAEEVSPGFLLTYERFLRRPRTLKRLNQKGKEVVTESKGLSDAGVHNYIRGFKARMVGRNSDHFSMF